MITAGGRDVAANVVVVCFDLRERYGYGERYIPAILCCCTPVHWPSSLVWTSIICIGLMAFLVVESAFFCSMALSSTTRTADSSIIVIFRDQREAHEHIFNGFWWHTHAIADAAPNRLLVFIRGRCQRADEQVHVYRHRVDGGRRKRRHWSRKNSWHRRRLWRWR